MPTVISGPNDPALHDDNGSFSYPLSRTIVLYEYTDKTETVSNDSLVYFFDSISTKKIAETESDENGFFQFKISKIGTYSIFVVQDDIFYDDRRDGQGGVNPITVFNDNVTIHDIYLDYNACY